MERRVGSYAGRTSRKNSESQESHVIAIVYDLFFFFYSLIFYGMDCVKFIHSNVYYVRTMYAKEKMAIIFAGIIV